MWRNAVATVICPVCRASIIATKLKCHVEKHIGQSRFRCVQCRKKFVFKWEIDHHLKERHQIDPDVDDWTEASDFEENPRLRLKCLMCDEMMRTREAIITHAKYHNLCRERKSIGKEEAEEMLRCKLEAMDVGTTLETAFDPPGRREWVCPLCRAKKHLFAELNVHMLEHQGAKFVCKACPFAFNTHREAARHISQKHPSRPPGMVLSKPDEVDLLERLNTICAICNGEIKNLKALERHIALHNPVQMSEEASDCEEPPIDTQPDYEFICCICRVSVRRRPNLTNHLSQHFKEYRYRCKRCGSGFVWRRSILRHIENYHGMEKDLIEVLGNAATENNDYRCSVCQEELPDKKSVYMHTELHSDSKSGRMTEPVAMCPLCGKTVDRWSLMKSHVTKHLEIHKFMCLQCDDETYTSLSTLTVHMKERHHNVDLETGYRRISEMPQGDFSHQCAICGQTLTSESKIMRHAEKHSKTLSLPAARSCMPDIAMKQQTERALMCSICSKTLPDQEKLKRHIRAHWIDTSVLCNLCPKTFPGTTDLAAHAVLEHGGATVTPHERNERLVFETMCNVCGEKIASKKETKVHAFLHNFHREDLFTCTICFKTFPSLSEWTEHKMTAKCVSEMYKVNEWVIVG